MAGDQESAAGGPDAGAGTHHPATAEAIGGAADDSRRQPHDEERGREAAMHRLARPAELCGDVLAERADEIAGRPRRGELRQAETIRVVPGSRLLRPCRIRGEAVALRRGLARQDGGAEGGFQGKPETLPVR